MENRAGHIQRERAVKIESATQIGGGCKRADYLSAPTNATALSANLRSNQSESNQIKPVANIDQRGNFPLHPVPPVGKIPDRETPHTVRRPVMF